MKIVKGNLITLAKNGEFDVIVHGCNCHCIMGAGVAQAIKQHFPQAYAADCKTVKGNPSKLGTYTIAEAKTNSGESFSIVNAYTQYNLGPHFSFEAFEKCMKSIVKEFSQYRIGMPKIGCGIGGADWDKVKPLLEQIFSGVDLTVVEL